MKFAELILYSVLGYCFTLLGIMFGFYFLAAVLKPAKKNITYSAEINVPKEATPEDLYSELDDLSDNEESDRYDNSLYHDEPMCNEPISYMDIKNYLSDENKIEVYRKREDNSYDILQRKISNQ